MYPYAASIEESRRKLQFDLYYIKHMSFFLDMYVLLKTSKTILFGTERARQPKPAAETNLRHTDVKTETLFSIPRPGPSWTKVASPNTIDGYNATPEAAFIISFRSCRLQSSGFSSRAR